MTYTFDTRNRLSTVTDWTGKTTSLNYDKANRMVSTGRPNGTMRINTWDAAGQLTSVNDRLSAATGLPIVAMKIGYDAAGRLTNKLELPPWPAATALPARAGVYNTDNQLITLNSQTIASDVDGNMTSAPGPTSVTPLQSYSWNARNQLTAAPGGLSHSYDAEGMRVSTTIGTQTTIYVNDPQGSLSRMLWRVRPDGTRTFYIYGPGLLYEIEETGNAARYYHYDHLGSTLAISEQNGAVTSRANYSAYGVLLQSTGTLNTPFLWQGMFGVVTDGNGLLYIRARYYHAYLARFMNEDPLGLSAGPNVYAYCNGNPVMAVDPDGELVWIIVGAVAGFGLDYTAQVIGNYAGGKSGSAAWTDVNKTLIALSAIGGAITGGVGGIASKQVGSAVFRAAINGGTNSGVSAAVQVSKNANGVNGNSNRDDVFSVGVLGSGRRHWIKQL